MTSVPSAAWTNFLSLDREEMINLAALRAKLVSGVQDRGKNSNTKASGDLVEGGPPLEGTRGYVEFRIGDHPARTGPDRQPLRAP
jgi:hypothetical protein